MLTAEFRSVLEADGAVWSASSPDAVRHFGNAAQELRSAMDGRAVCPVSNSVILRVTGKDRAKFLHNFCTSNISTLAAGDTCETFFPNVKAHVVAHGLISAGEQHHDILLLNSDGQTPWKHLSRYVISEDVDIQVLPDRCVFAVCGSQSSNVVGSLRDQSQSVTDALFRTTWNDFPVSFVAGPVENASELWARLLADGVTPAGEDILHHLRIQEGYPLIGIDLTTDHLAPESGRIAQTISYQKGCYLGQEPIARLDALGHLNRQLYRATARVRDSAPADADLPQVTSASAVPRDTIPVLVCLPVRQVTGGQPITARLPNGQIVELQVNES
ncbi:MAG: hypothetical protein R3C49_17185 [Planctomycetaceae bacterium]